MTVASDLIHLSPYSLRLRLGPGRLCGSDVIGLYRALDCSHVDTLFPITYESPPAFVEHAEIAPGALRDLTGVSSAPDLDLFGRRLLALRISTIIDGDAALLQPVVTAYRAPRRRTAPRAFCLVTNGDAARRFGVSGEYLQDAVPVQAEWLRGLTAPSAWILSRYIVIRHLGILNAARAARGNFRVESGQGAGEVVLQFDREGWLHSAFGRPLIGSNGQPMHRAEISRVVRQTASELLSRGVSMTWQRVGGYSKPRWRMTLAGPGPAGFAVDFAGRVEPLPPEPVEMPPITREDLDGDLFDDGGWTVDPDADEEMDAEIVD